MRNLKTLILLAVVTSAVLLAAIVYRPHTASHPQINAGAMLPGLTERLDKIQTVTILHAGESVTLQHQNGTWSIAEKANYPAMDVAVRELLLGLANIQRIEAKTRNPKYYSNLGLANPDKKDSEASQIELKDQLGKAMARVIIGKRRPATENNGHSDFYAMLQDNPQTWLVEGAMPAIGAAGSWLKRTLLELDRSRIAEVTVTHSDGETLHLIPKAPGQLGMTLEGLKPNETFQNDYAVDDIADRFTRMQLEDVRPLGQLKWPDKPDLQVEAQTKDGLVVRITAAKIDGQPWIKLAALASTKGQDKPAPTTKTHGAAVVATASQEAADLNTHWQGWAYTLADWAYQALNKRRAELVKPLVKDTTLSPPQTVPSEHPSVTVPDRAVQSTPKTPATEAVSEPPDNLLEDDIPTELAVPGETPAPQTTNLQESPSPPSQAPSAIPKPAAP